MHFGKWHQGVIAGFAICQELAILDFQILFNSHRMIFIYYTIEFILKVFLTVIRSQLYVSRSISVAE